MPQVRRSLDVNRARGVRVRLEPVGKVDRGQIEDDVGPNIDQAISADPGRRVEFRQIESDQFVGAIGRRFRFGGGGRVPTSHNRRTDQSPCSDDRDSHFSDYFSIASTM